VPQHELTLLVSASPVLSPSVPVSYNPPPSATQPWTWTYALGGIATAGSPWDPDAPSAPPSGAQYAFIQTSAAGAANERQSSMSCLLTGLVPSVYYQISFYLATRGGGYLDTQSQVTLFVAGQNVYTSVPDVSDAGGWTQQFSTRFTVSSTGAVPLVFFVSSTDDADHAILIDSVVVGPPGTLGTLAVGDMAIFLSPGIGTLKSAHRHAAACTAQS
jgi:hypothetical protein